MTTKNESCQSYFWGFVHSKNNPEKKIVHRVAIRRFYVGKITAYSWGSETCSCHWNRALWGLWEVSALQKPSIRGNGRPSRPFRWRAPTFYWRPTAFHWRLHIFVGDPKIFFGDPRFLLDTSRFSLETPDFPDFRWSFTSRPPEFHRTPHKIRWRP